MNIIRRSIRNFYSSVGAGGTAFILGMVVVAGVATAYMLREEPVESVAQSTLRSVTVHSVALLSQGGAALATAGTVSAQSEATVRAERGGELTSINASLGQSVAAGTILAEMNSASERAAVLSAQGALAAAEASRAKVAKGSRAEEQAKLQTGVGSARSTAVTTLLSTYATVNNSIKNTADSMISNADTASPQFGPVTSNSQAKNDVQNKRLALGPTLRRQAELRDTLTVNADLNAELDTTQAEVRVVLNFYESLISALNSSVSSPSFSDAQIAAFKLAAVTARTELTATLSALDTARAGISNAGQSLSASTGPTVEDISSADAAVTQAQGALASARAMYEKSIIRAPISGTINAFSLKRGDFVSMGQEVVTIANNNALEVVTYITERDSARVTVGNKVTLDGGITGVITKVAPAVDPTTKKIEVRIGLPASAKLLNGQSVVVTLDQAKEPTRANATLTLPLSTLKVGSLETVVFTVDGQNTLVSHPVKLGLLLGDRVEVLEGITADMQLVLDARGHKAGEVVTVQ